MQTQTYKQEPHAVLPKASHDELARQEFVKSYKYFLATQVAPLTKQSFEFGEKPKYQASTGQEPSDRHAVRKLMSDNEQYQFWSSLQRSSQEMMWSSCVSSVQRQLPELIKIASNKGSGVGGSLSLDSTLKIPKYHLAVDIHCQPGGYHTESAANDVAAGAIYDRAVYIYAMGRMGTCNQDMGASQAAWIANQYPDFRPLRILDLGCSVGHSTLPYKETFPDAEVHAIDVAAPMLRYAHARAESLGVPIHFSQQNAESLSFEDESFDLIVSHILVHETSSKAIRNIMRECQRVLKPGGMVVHAETPPYEGMEPYDQFMFDWDTYNNNEPFWGKSHEIKPAALASETGFDPSKVFEAMAPSVFEAAEAKQTGVFQGGDFAGGGVWYLNGYIK